MNYAINRKAFNSLAHLNKVIKGHALEVFKVGTLHLTFIIFSHKAE